MSSRRPASSAGSPKWTSLEADKIFNTPLKVQRKPPPVKTTLAAVFLLIVGIVFSFSGLGVFFSKGFAESLPFFLIAGIGLIPGAYHTTILLRAYLGHPGFDYSMVPSYDD
eukprot:TRINITY_DN24039_c0_g1_i1.p1 TRINITY_DN24039_c0_g1~~TRINITY_DN24039_c0_g1_i1.p1  ORF type:complete len:111 (+),score=20.54 TRINITY_DN24039_c0_g1_i1:92-424(+)